MSLGFNTNTNPFQPIQGSGFVFPTFPQEQTDTHDPTASSLSQSLAEALMVQFLPAWPVLQQPGPQDSSSIAAITAAVGAKYAEIGADIWDGYLKHLAEQKIRIADYLNSPAYRHFLEANTLQGKVQQEINTSPDANNPILNATQFNSVLTGRIESASRLWADAIDGVSNYVSQNRDVNPAAALFVVASFAITATYIGDFINVVDVASTNMVTVKPIQDSVSNVLAMVPQQIQEQFALTINLFVIGLINFSNAEAIVKAGNQQQRAPTNWESVTTFAHNVLEKVEGNIVNGYLMAMLVNSMERLGPTAQDRETQIGKLAILAKAMMLSTAVAALLKAATPDLQLNGLIFGATMTKPLKAMSEDDKRLLNELSPLVTAFNKLREESGMSQEFWANLTESLGNFFDGNPSIEDLVSPATVYANIVSHLFSRDIEV